jgi:hypothetical protein
LGRTIAILKNNLDSKGLGREMLPVLRVHCSLRRYGTALNTSGSGGDGHGIYGIAGCDAV